MTIGSVNGKAVIGSTLLVPNVSYKDTPVSVTSWSYVTTTITLNVASHTFVAGDYIEVMGLTSTTNTPTGIELVTSVTPTTIVFTHSVAPTGTAGVSSATVKGHTALNGMTIAGTVIQVQNFTTGTVATGTVTIPYDNTIPQITEGTQFMSLAFTPKKANSKLKISVNAMTTASATSLFPVIGLFRDSGVSAIASCVDIRTYTNGGGGMNSFISYIDAISLSTTTFTVRAGVHSAGTITLNGVAGGALLGGTMASSITIEEIAQ